MPERIDKLIVARGLAQSRTQAQQLIAESLVQVKLAGQWQLVTKPSVKYASDIELLCEASDAMRYVSRAGLKLEAGLKTLGESIEGCHGLDIGQSTGGFTDCLLQHGAADVVGIEVGHDQLVDRLRQDERVQCLEGVNARGLPTEKLLSICPTGFDIVVMDVSFISQKLILPGLPAVMGNGAVLISLVKPQFELDKASIGKGGIVRDAALYKKIEAEFTALIMSLGFQHLFFQESPIQGGDGNREFLLGARLENYDCGA